MDVEAAKGGGQIGIAESVLGPCSGGDAPSARPLRPVHLARGEDLTSCGDRS